MPDGMRDAVAARAKANGRSMNSEIVQILQDALEQPSLLPGYRDEAEKLAEEQSEKVKQMVFDALRTIYSKEK